MELFLSFTVLFCNSFFKEEWQRLLQSPMKPVWLRIDFDKWKIEDSDNEEKNPNEEEDIEQQLKVANFIQILVFHFFSISSSAVMQKL